MRLRPWAGAHHLLPVLVLLVLLVLHVGAEQQQHQGNERHFYIAAVEIDWKYHGNDTSRSGPTYRKVVFREYEPDFKQAKTHPSWLGLLGPTLRAQTGETMVVHFRNMASAPHSLHPHGIAYGKQSEGAHYFDNTSQKEKEDDVVRPNGDHVYYWEVTEEVSPQPRDPPCLTYSYVSHQHVVEDYNSGLIGALLICKPGSLDESGNQVGFHHEFVFLFGVFDEKVSRFRPSGFSPDNHVKHTINGFTAGALPDVSVCAHASVSLHLLGMSSGPEVFSVHLNGQVLQHYGHKVSSVGVVSGAATTATMKALYTGRWLLSSHTITHMEAGMHGFLEVRSCDGFKAPVRRLTVKQKRESREWKYFIAAEEVMWDYAPEDTQHVDDDFKQQFFRQSSTRIGSRYKKAVYTLYNNESFSHRLESKQRRNELGILGPVIRAQIRDVIKIVFRNMASRPYSIYPHGLTIDKTQEGVNYPAGGNQSHAVQPGETYTYVWNVMEEDEPLPDDPRCLTRFYHSAVDPPRDIASGLVGPLLICKGQSLNRRNVQLKADKEQHAMLAVFDENRSWYIDENIRQFTDRSKVNKADQDFYKSNVMHSINGYMFEAGPVLGFCNAEIATWHVSSVGAQDFIQTATFYGHSFELNGRTEDYLSLYPMTGETITLTMDNIGVWLLATLNTHQTVKGMRLKFQDVECFRDYVYEYSDDDDPKALTDVFNVWNPLSKAEIQEKDAKPTPPKPPQMTDEAYDYSLMWAEKLDIRSGRNTSSPDMELLDLDFLDYNDGGTKTTGLESQKNSSGSAVVEKLDLSFLDYGGDRNSTDTPPAMERNNQSSLASQKNSSGSDVVEMLDLSLLDLDGDLKTGPESQKNSSQPEIVEMLDLSLLDLDGDLKTGLEPQKKDSRHFEIDDWLDLSSLLDPSVFDVDAMTSDPTEMDQSNVTDTNQTQAQNLTLNDSSNTTELNVSDASGVGNESRGITNLTETPQVNTSSTSDTGNLNGTQTSQELLTRGDVFSQAKDDNTTNNNLTGSGLNRLASDVIESFFSSVEIPDLFSLLSDWQLDDKGTTKTIEELGSLTDSSDNTTKDQNTTSVNVTGSKSRLEEIRDHQGLLLEMNSTSSSAEMTTNKSVDSGNTTLPDSAMTLDLENASEEVLIYLQHNKTKGIKSTSVKTQDQNWKYDATHQEESIELPDYMMKYFRTETPKPTKPPKKTKQVNLRHWPQKGQGMKTRKRKEYKAQARSGLPFSPRGFNPAMTPRGSRPNMPKPVSDEQALINIPVVIGVPRPDFSDYELYIPGDEPFHAAASESDLTADEYEYVTYRDPYSDHEDIKNLNLDDTAKYYLKYAGSNVKTYFIAAEEVQWDYAGYGQRRQDKAQLNLRETRFTKVVFREYLDSSFRTPAVRGEMDEHLGILGPIIKAEVGQSIMVVFKNNAHRPFSLHPNGVTYSKQSEGLSYEDGSKYWYKYDNEVQPNTTFTYIWNVGPAVGPTSGESRCRTWAYYSGVNPEKDINSGLIGPLLVCREGTMKENLENVREFVLLFMTFDESQSWYYEPNREMMQRKNRRRVMDPNFREHLKFHSINGIIFNLKGLRMYTNQLVTWHLFNMGSPHDFQSVNFHGQTFVHKKTHGYRQAVHPLLPGSFSTLEMFPSKPGLWQLDTEIGFNQLEGMQTLFLVLDNECYRPLGLESGSVHNDQMTAINTRGYWEPYLARLNNQGKYNAWSTEQEHSWIQVDFQRPVVVSQVATQGARQMFHSQYVEKFSISYSTDRRTWIFYKGDSGNFRKVFTGNTEAYGEKRNTFFPPLVGRFIRFHPVSWYNKATVRLEYYGCELDGCSVPLGMESGVIEDRRITASSVASSWYSGPWRPSLARLNMQGTINAWQAKVTNMNQWLQVELPQVKKITGIITQGAKSLGTEMYVISYTLQFSDDGLHWTHYTDDENIPSRTFIGNTDNNGHVKNYIYPPIFSRFIRIKPKSWMNSITMRVELLGCEFE